MKRVPLVKINPRRISRAAIGPVVSTILEGGVVAYPTETVYGLGANALDRKAVRRVFEIKGRSPDKPLILLVRNLRELKTLVRELPPSAKALMDRFWPDGLTLVLEASSRVSGEALGGGSTIALRISGSPVVRALLDLARVPLTASSANLAGYPPPVTAAEVQAQLGDRVDLILDGGQSPEAIPSTILDVREEPATLIRRGRITLTEIQQVVAVRKPMGAESPEPANILLVCTGNTCRSPMAEGLLTEMISAKGIDHIQIRSAGTHAVAGNPAASWATEVAMAEDGVDLSKHRARRLTKDLLRQSDLILAMTLSHARHIERMGRRFARKTHLLTSFLNTDSGDLADIEDPMGQSRPVYQRVYRQIRRELERILPALVKWPGS